MPTAAGTRLRTLLLSAAAGLAGPAHLFAQGDGGPVIVENPGTNYVLETFIVLALFGAALFAVCKSSRRT